MSDLVIHGLSIFPESEDGLCRIRSTIRSGSVSPGQELFFTTPGGEKFTLKLISMRDGPSRHVTLIVKGDQESISNFKGGYYLFGIDA